MRITYNIVSDHLCTSIFGVRVVKTLALFFSFTHTFLRLNVYECKKTLNALLYILYYKKTIINDDFQYFITFQDWVVRIRTRNQYRAARFFVHRNWYCGRTDYFKYIKTIRFYFSRLLYPEKKKCTYVKKKKKILLISISISLYSIIILTTVVLQVFFFFYNDYYRRSTFSFLKEKKRLQIIPFKTSLKCFI